MKTAFIGSILSVLFIHHTWSQCDYSIPRYGFATEKNVFYGTAIDYNGNTDSLFMDIYYPVGSTEKTKPLILWAFGGGFFQGQRQDLNTICQESAKRGFVAATIDYRIGFDGHIGLNPPFAFDPAEVLRAGFRGTVDMKGAIRFLKAKHLEYEIDINRVWTGGISAGAIVALNAAYLDKNSEKPKECGAITPVAAKKRPDLGSIEGDLHVNGYDSKVQGVFNFFGALLDTNAIDPADRIAVFSYHQTGDPVVPCLAKTPYFQISFISANYPIVYGSCVINDRFKHIGLDPQYYESWLYNGNQHASHDDAAILNFMIQNANPVLCNSISGATEIKNSFAKTIISPNPAIHDIQLYNAPPDCHYSIMDISGITVVHSTLLSEKSIDIKHLSTGMYLLRLQNKSEIHTIKWIKI
jgi:hypothetical protein